MKLTACESLPDLRQITADRLLMNTTGESGPKFCAYAVVIMQFPEEEKPCLLLTGHILYRRNKFWFYDQDMAVYPVVSDDDGIVITYVVGHSHILYRPYRKART